MSIWSVFLLHVINYVNIHTVFRFVTDTTIYSGHVHRVHKLVIDNEGLHRRLLVEADPA